MTDETREPASIEDLPLDPDGRIAYPLVHTELGIAIHFNTRTQEFEASFGATKGAAGTPMLHSTSFAAVVDRIRQRALVVPVQAYVVKTSQLGGRRQGAAREVVVEPRTVLEYHKGRQRQFVVRETQDRRGRSESYDVLYLPQPEEVERLRMLAQALDEEEARHRAATDDLRARQEGVYLSMRKLTEADVTYVQQSGQQRTDPGMVSFITEPEPEEDEQCTSTFSGARCTRSQHDASLPHHDVLVGEWA